MNDIGDQKIVKLTVSNLMRVSAAQIEPNGNLVVLSGDNGQGKTSVLNAIWFALAGTRNISDEPVRRGANKAEACVELTDLVVTRRWTSKGGTTLIVANKAGEVLKSPQELLDSLFAALTFDPLHFSRLAGSKRADEKQQSVAILKNLVGIDFAELEQTKAKHFQSRTLVNNQLSQVQILLQSTPQHPDAPVEEISTEQLIGKLNEARKHNASRGQLQNDCLRAKDAYLGHQSFALRLDQEIAALKAKHDSAMALEARAKKDYDNLEAKLTAVNPMDEESLLLDIQESDQKNAKYRVNKKRKELAKQQQELIKQRDGLTTAIEDIEASKAKQLAEAKYPVDGLSFDDDGVKLDQFPFGQASTAQQIRASLAMGMALHPKLRVILIRDGADHLDQKSIDIIKKMAEDNGCQVWLERVVTDKNTSFIIEDGMVKEQEEIEPKTK